MGYSLLFGALVGRHLLAHRLRSGLTLLGVALGVAVAVAVQLANHTALASFAGTVRAMAGEARLQIVSRFGDLDERMIERLRPLTDQAIFSPLIEGTALLAGRTDVAFRLLGVDLLVPPAFRDYDPSRQVSEDIHRDLEGIYLTESAASRLGVKPGDQLRLLINDGSSSIRISGVLPAYGRTHMLDPQVAFLDIAPAQELLNRVGRLDRIDVIPRVGTDLRELQRNLAPLLPPGVEAIEPEQNNRQAERLLASFRVNLLALSIVALIVGAFLIYNAVAVSVIQRRAEVAILRAIGTSRGQIFTLFACEAGIIGLLGALLGLAFGALLAGGAVRMVVRTVNAIYLAVPVQGVAWTPRAFMTGLGMGVGLSLVAALVPALEAARTPAALAMRPGSWEARRRQMLPVLTGLGTLALGGAAVAARGTAVAGLPVWGYLAVALIIFGCSLLMPLFVLLVAGVLQPAADKLAPPFRLAVRNFRGAAGRNAVAVASMMVGVAMMIGVATMVGSFRQTVSDWIGTVLPADYYLKPMAAGGVREDATLSAGLMPAVRAVRGVQAVEGFRSRDLSYEDTVIRLGAGDMQVVAHYGALVLRDPGRVADALQSLVGYDRVLVSEALVIKQGIDRGDMLTLPTAAGSRRFQVIGVYYDYSSDQGYVIMDRGTYRRYWHDEALSSIAVFARPGSEGQALRSRIQSVLGDRPVTVTANSAIRRNVLRVFDNTFTITYALHFIAMSVSLLGVVSTLFTLVLERQREISILRYLGLTRTQVRRMIVAEAGLIGFTGALAGLGTGGMLSWLLIHVINRQSFGWTIQWHPPYSFVACSLGVVFLAALAAGMYPAGLAARVPVAQGLRHE